MGDDYKDWAPAGTVASCAATYFRSSTYAVIAAPTNRDARWKPEGTDSALDATKPGLPLILGDYIDLYISEKKRILMEDCNCHR